MKKYLLLLNLVLLSCKSFKEVYMENPRNLVLEKEIDGTQDWFRIVIVVENSLEGSDFYVVSNDSDKDVFYNGKIKKDSSTGVAEIIKADNYSDTFLSIDNREYKIIADTFRKYRYVIVKKKDKKSRIQLVYTNQLPGYW